MIIKSFTAPTVASALKVIKEQMGGDAVILKTRLCPPFEAALTGNRIEVTACIDEKSITPQNAKKNNVAPVVHEEVIKKAEPSRPIPTPPAAKIADNYDFVVKLEKKLDLILNSHRTSGQPDGLSRRAASIYLSLTDADIPVDMAGQLAKDIDIRIAPDSDADSVALRIMTDELAVGIVSEIAIEPGMKVMFAGPSGAGKTSALAKLAARLSVGEGKKVTLSSLDNAKVSAYEEIGGYAEILDVPLDLSGHFGKKQHQDSILLIDTPSLTGHENQRTLVRKIRRMKPDILFLVFSVCTRSRDLVDAVNLFESIRPTHLLASHLDETIRWGALLTMTKYLEIPIAFAANSPGGVGTLESVDPETAARRILNMERSTRAK
jgi:flagellar biosynthesis protein FlhF